MRSPICLIALASLFLFSCSGCAGLEGFDGQVIIEAPSESYEETGEVTINGRSVSSTELSEFAQTYGAYPVPGDYWYDSTSGMWGRNGMPAEGFLYAGHDFGPIRQNASHGTSGVVVNGRMLQQAEVLSLSALTGPIPVGRYWLDSMGNYGYEGYPVAAGNLFMLANSAANGGGYGGGGGGYGGGGDNTWNTRFSSGNYDSSSGAGYVQLPNGGFVSHGM